LRLWVTLAAVFWLTSCISSWWGTPETVTVERGDTLYSISKRYSVPLRDLIDTNNLKPPYTLKVGQVLHIPANSFHIVAKGDTLYSISRRYGVDMQTLKKINDLQEPYTLMIGQRISLYGNAYTTHMAAPSPAPAKKYRVSSVYTSKAKAKPRATAKPAKPAAKKVSAKPSTPRKKTQQASRPISQKRATKFSWPVKGTIVSKFGTIGKGRANDGINIKAAAGSPVKAADSGTVAYAGNELKGFGNLILIRHNDGWITAYAHNARLLVKKGKKVRRGEKIATVGTTGGVNSPQLHFEVRAGKKAVNPVKYLP